MIQSLMFLVDPDNKIKNDDNLIFFKDDVYYSLNQASFEDYMGDFPIAIVELDTGGCNFIRANLNMKILNLDLDEEFDEIKKKSLNEILTYLYDRIEQKLIEK